jgi:hypothetical protein
MDGGIKFDVSANTAKFEADMGRVKNSASTTAGAIGKAFSGLGGLFAGGALVAGLTGLLRKMDDISDGARRIGISSTEFQKIGNAANLVGTSVEAVNKAMIRAGVAANKAAREGGTMADAFARANLDPAKFAAAGLEERIKMVAKAQQAANGDAQKMSNLFEAIGIKAAGIDFSALAEEMGNVNAASNETVEALARANDELDKAKQNATIFGANLVKGITDAAERFGSMLGGGAAQTSAEMDEQIARDNAIAALRNRGELLPDDSTLRKKAIPTPAGPVYGAEELIAGPNAQENARRINAEMEKMRQEAEASKKAMQGFVDELEQAAPEADKTTKQLERQAQLLEEANTKRRKAYETEVALTDARLAGNKALEESILQAQDFNQVLEETDSFETAANVTATRSSARKAEEQVAGGQGGGSGGLGPSVSGAPMSQNMRVAELRGAARQSVRDQRASQLAANGMFRSAIRAQDAGQRAYDRAMDSANLRDLASQYDFAGREAGNVGEALSSFRDQHGMDYLDKLRETPGYDRNKGEMENFKNYLRESAKTPEERRQEEEEARNKARAPGGGGDSGGQNQEQGTGGQLDRIISIMEERLPIRVLA